MKSQWRLVAGIILILLIITFAILNVDNVPVNFGFGKITAPLIIVIFVSLLLGALLTLLVSTTSSTRTNREIRSLREKAANQEKQIEEAVQTAEAPYKDKISQLENELVQKDNENKHLQNELVNRMTMASPASSAAEADTEINNYPPPE